MTTTDVTTRVAAGAAWLDEHHPGWVARIDPDRLRMHLPGRCVLGQLLGDYYAAPLTVADAVAYGFDTNSALSGNPGDPGLYPRVQAEFADLGTAWRDLIAARRTAGNQLVTAR